MLKLYTHTSRLLFSAALVGMLSMPAYAQENKDIDDLMSMSLKDLTEMKVTSVSKKSEKANEAAAAIYVITQEDIKRSGMTNIPELLRMVPGMQVSRQGSSGWAISSRGFALDFANKLLVLIDGRTIYNPLFSGVLWDEQGVPLEEIERIEVIRGPGSTLWGANAVNGVINIITKHSADAQGGQVTSSAGSFEKNNTVVHYGGEIDKDTTYKAYVQYYDQGKTEFANGTDKKDDWDTKKVGFKIDKDISDKDSFTLQGDYFDQNKNYSNDLLPSAAGAFDPVAGLVVSRPDHADVTGANLIGKYKKALDDGSDIDFQVYYDYTGRRNSNVTDYDIHTLDFDMQDAMAAMGRHEVVWGLGYRLITDSVDNSDVAIFDKDGRTTNLYSAFVQDKVTLSSNALYLTLGSKFEHNSYTGFEVQPNARLSWLIDDNQTAWASATRAVRTPSQGEMDIRQTQQVLPGPIPLALQGNDQYGSEEMFAYELGYRIQPTDNLSIDATTFLNEYNDLRTFEYDGAFSFNADNKSKAHAMGFELATKWNVTNDWQLTGSYSYIDMDVVLDPGSADVVSEPQEGKTPKNIFNVRSHYNLDSEWSMDNAVYYQGELKYAAGAAPFTVKDYYRFDTQFTWKPNSDMDFSLIGQNLLQKEHQEFLGSTYNSASYIPRAVYGKVTVRF